MADTITLLDGLLFTKPDTADVWTCDGSGIECLRTIPVTLPPDISGARVIFNSADTTAATRFHVRVKVTKLTELTSGAAPDKTENTQALEWTTLTPPEVLETGAIDVSAAIEATLHIDIALTDVTAVVAGVEIRVCIRKEAALDEWTELTRFTFGAGLTAYQSNVKTETAAGQTVLAVTDPTAVGHLDHVGKNIFLEDTATIAQCEIAFLVSTTGD